MFGEEGAERSRAAFVWRKLNKFRGRFSERSDRALAKLVLLQARLKRRLQVVRARRRLALSQVGRGYRGGEDSFVLYRIIGNALPPRHDSAQLLENLGFQLANEPDLPGCKKVWLVNRIIDPDAHVNVMRLLNDHEQEVVDIPFEAEVYRGIDIGPDVERVNRFLASADQDRLTDESQIRAACASVRRKNLYLMNNNGARNLALKLGRDSGRAKWILPWDGNCFLTADAWLAIQLAIRRNPGLPYHVVPMIRALRNDSALDPRNHGRAAREEPQLIFHRDSSAVFDERMPYGRRPKADLLKRLAVPGPWFSWSNDPWDQQSLPDLDEKHCYGARCGWVMRLGSGNPKQEVGPNAARLRTLSREQAILNAISAADARCGITQDGLEVIKTRSVVQNSKSDGASLIAIQRPIDSSKVSENPPAFVWRPHSGDGVQYIVKVSRSDRFPLYRTQKFRALRSSYFRPAKPFTAGVYFWSVARWDSELRRRSSGWSPASSFVVAPGTATVHLPDAAAAVSGAPVARPRLWLDANGLAGLRTTALHNPEDSGWSIFFDNSVCPWIDQSPPPEPDIQATRSRDRAIWRSQYSDCQSALNRIRAMAVAGRVLDDTRLIVAAQNWLLAIAKWDPDGATAIEINDEAAFRTLGALAWGYDWLHDTLDDDQRGQVRDALSQRTRAVFRRLSLGHPLLTKPLDSHRVRAVSAALVPGAVALLHDVEEAEEWLVFATRYLSQIYSPWCDEDGGWAEGPHYWMTGLAPFLEAIPHIQNSLGIDLTQRRFLHKTGQFALFARPPGSRRSSFCDDARLGEVPSRKMAQIARYLGAISGDGRLQWYHDEVAPTAATARIAPSDLDWWDLNFDEMAYQTSQLSKQAPAATAPSDGPVCKVFQGIGWAALQAGSSDPKRVIRCLIKASPFGSHSHSHADQGAFTLSAYGEELAIQSGHYVSYGSAMHLEWRRKTHSKNALLVDGGGQYSGEDGARRLGASGQLDLICDSPQHMRLRADLTRAYSTENPIITSCSRDYHFVEGRYLILVDRVKATQPICVQWLVHGLSEFNVDPTSAHFSLTRPLAGLQGCVAFSTSLLEGFEQTEGYPGVPQEEVAGLATSYRLAAQFEAARQHVIVTALSPHPAGHPGDPAIMAAVADDGHTVKIEITGTHILDVELGNDIPPHEMAQS